MSLSKEVLKKALPAVGEMFFYMMIWVIDMKFVGNYGGPDAVSAVGFTSEVVFTAANILVNIGLSIGITTMVAKNTGADNIEGAKEYLSLGLFVGIIGAFILSTSLGLFSRPILSFFGVNGKILINSIEFMRIVVIGIFFNMLNNMLNAGLRGSGNTLFPMIVSFIVLLITVVLDWIFIFGRFGLRPMGIKGSAVATSAAYFTGFLILAFYYSKYSNIRPGFSYIKSLNRKKFKKLFSLSIPSSLQEAAFSISRLITLSFILKGLGDAAYAANTITNSIESVSYMPGYGFSVAATALVGQRTGAKDYKNAKKFTYISVLYGAAIMLTCSLIFLIFPRNLMVIFVKDEITVNLGIICLMVASIEQPFLAVSMILAGAIKGSGDTRTPFFVSLISSWAIRITLAYYVIFVLKLSVAAVWAVTALQYAFESITMWIIFRKKSKHWV